MYDLRVFKMARIDDGEVNVTQEVYFRVVKVRVTGDGIAPLVPGKAQPMIACGGQADEIETMGANLKVLPRDFMDNDVVCRLLQNAGTKKLQ